MKRLLLLSILILFFPAFLSAQTDSAARGIVVEAATGTKYAILIGVNDYVRLSKLRYAKNDIEALRDELYKTGFEEKNVFSLTCSSESKNLPTKENIELIVDVVLDRAKEGDIVIIAMSGHGIEADGEARFCPPDTNPSDLLRTTVSIKNIFESLEQSKATFKLMIVDACRDNPFTTRSVAGASALQTLADPPSGVMLLQSSRSGQVSYEDSELQRGVFTHYIVEGLRGKAADKEGRITLLGLTKYTMDETPLHVLNRFRSSQQPYLRGEITDFVLANVAAASSNNTSRQERQIEEARRMEERRKEELVGTWRQFANGIALGDFVVRINRETGHYEMFMVDFSDAMLVKPREISNVQYDGRIWSYDSDWGSKIVKFVLRKRNNNTFEGIVEGNQYNRLVRIAR